MQVQFEITDPTVHIAPMAFPTDEARTATLDYILGEYGKTVDELAQIVFTRVDDSGKQTIERALQYGRDVTRYARFA